MPTSGEILGSISDEEYFQDMLVGMSYEEADRFLTDIELIDREAREITGYFLHIGHIVTRDFHPKRIAVFGDDIGIIKKIRLG